MQAQDGQELLETLREIAEMRGKRFPVRFEFEGAPPQGDLGVSVAIVEHMLEQGLSLRGAPWVLEMKDNPVSGAFLEIRPTAEGVE